MVSIIGHLRGQFFVLDFFFTSRVLRLVCQVGQVLVKRSNNGLKLLSVVLAVRLRSSDSKYDPLFTLSQTPLGFRKCRRTRLFSGSIGGMCKMASSYYQLQALDKRPMSTGWKFDSYFSILFQEEWFRQVIVATPTQRHTNETILLFHSRPQDQNKRRTHPATKMITWKLCPFLSGNGSAMFSNSKTWKCC